MVFTTPIPAALAHRFPGSRLTYLVETAAAPVVRHLPEIDDLLVVERPRGLRRVTYDLRLMRELHARQFDLAIDLHGGPRAALLTRASGAPRRIGYDIPGRTWAYTDRVPWTPSLTPPRHSVLNQWDLLAPLGIGPADPAINAVRMPVSTDDAQAVRQRLIDAGVPGQAAVAVLHVSAGNPFRRWPADRFAALAAALTSDPMSLHVVITSGPSDTAAAAAVTEDARRLSGPLAHRVIRAGEFDLSELAALVSLSRLYVGGDSGPLHVAGTTRTPVVALFGPTLPERSMPWRDPAVPSMAVDAGPLPCRPCHQRTCVTGDFRCLSDISVAQVLDACRRVLEVPLRPEPI
ncbi:MAG: glycosyltransferase family 9 protein [Acidobacteria bacterium]|nr:glycosyltransferase family 9 protein [Acidobacteriota bacterium]